MCDVLPINLTNNSNYGRISQHFGDTARWILKISLNARESVCKVLFSCTLCFLLTPKNTKKMTMKKRTVPGAIPIYILSTTVSNGGARNFHLGVIAPGVWALPSPSGVRGEVPVDGCSPEAEAICRHRYRFWLQKRSTFENFRTINPLILDDSVSQWGD